METKVQNWRDDLRLPCLVNPADTASLVAELELLRKPPLPFQSKHLPALKRNKWFVLKRDRNRRGLVVVWPSAQACVYISGEPPGKRQGLRIALLRIRVDPTFLSEGTGLTVFAATLSAETRTLNIEDTLIWKGRPLQTEEPFTKRFCLVNQWIEHYCILDARLLGGLDIRAAAWEPLAALRPTGVWMLQSDDAGRQPILWMAQHKELIPSPPRRAVQEEKGKQKEAEAEAEAETKAGAIAPILETGPLVAVATRDAGPEQWSLTSADGVSLGRALIRRLSVSTTLRSAKTVRVVVEWIPSFKKWEICNQTDLPARQSNAFLTV
jgi:hypothetical protein